MALFVLFMHIKKTKLAGVTIKILVRVWEVLISNHVRDTGYLESEVSRFFIVSPAEYRYVSRLGDLIMFMD